MKFIKNATDVVRLATAVLMGISAGLALARNTRELVRDVAEDDGLMEKLVHAQRARRKAGEEAK